MVVNAPGTGDLVAEAAEVAMGTVQAQVTARAQRATDKEVDHARGHVDAAAVVDQTVPFQGRKSSRNT